RVAFSLRSRGEANPAWHSARRCPHAHDRGGIEARARGHRPLRCHPGLAALRRADGLSPPVTSARHASSLRWDDVDDQRLLAERFELDRTRLRAVAYRMLGSVHEADDAVQEAWLRLNRSGANGVENLSGWLTTVVARVCLDMLRARKSKHEE